MLWITTGILAAMLAAVVAWVLFVPAADWLAQHDLGNATGSGLETARNNARGNLLALTAGLAAFGALIFTARSFTLQRRALELSQRSFEENARLSRSTLALTEQGQVTDRYTKAIEQLGSDKLDIRIGGIYALERIARDSEQDQPTVMEVLATFICERRRLEEIPDEYDSATLRAVESDVQAACTVLGRRKPAPNESQVSLPLTNLKGVTLTIARLARANLNHTVLVVARLPRAELNHADLNSANLSGANLQQANLSDANLADANLSGANLRGANFAHAKLDHAKLASAQMTLARLTSAELILAELIHADLARADLTGANLTNANLTGAELAKANLTNANLTRANLTHANLAGANLTNADLTGAIWPEQRIPDGWRFNDGRLVRRT